jgi:hypothetical protein
MTSKTYRDGYGYRVKFVYGIGDTINVYFFIPSSCWAITEKTIDLCTAAYLINVCENGVGGVCYAFETLL